MTSYIDDIKVDGDIKVDELSRRSRQQYTIQEQVLMKNNKLIILLQMENMKLTRTCVIFENQEIIAGNVVNQFKNTKIINVMVIAKTQSGKTGSMIATIKQYLTDANNIIPIENIYIITGLSSREWKDQTKERMPESIQSRVFHRSELPETFVDDVKNKKNVFIIMDEIQVAAKKGQTIYKTFEKAGLLSKQNLYEKDIKILEYTATPDGTIYDLMKWNNASSKILADPGDSYVSSYKLYTQKRVRQFKDLCGYDKETDKITNQTTENIQEIKYLIEKYPNPLWHFIRTKNGEFQKITITNFKKIFGDDYNYITYDMEDDMSDINDKLKTKPLKHTFIFIKERLRCAKTLIKSYLGIVYERYSVSCDDAAIIQGLVGRLTGYDDNHFSICFTNIESIKKYEKLWDSNFEDTSVKWRSKTTKMVNGVLKGKNTFNDPVDYDGFSISSEENENDREPTIQKCSSQEEAKKYYIQNLKTRLNGRGPNKIKPNDNGYYEATIRSVKKVYSCNDITNERKWGLSNNNYRYYPCYEDIQDPLTLQFWLLHY